MALAISDLYKDNETIPVPDGITVINKAGEIIVFNKAAERITGFNEHDLLHHNFHVIFPCSEEDKNYISIALKTEISYSNIFLKIASKSGGCVNVAASVTPIKQPSQGVSGVIIVFRNIEEAALLFSKLKEKNMELFNERNKNEAIFNSKLEGMFTINTDWEITSFNHAAENITGFSIREAIGKKCMDIFKSSKCNKGCHMESTMLGKQLSISNELIIQHKNGSSIPVRINSAALYNGLGNRVGAVGTFLDLSEVKNLTLHMEEKFRFANIIGRSSKMQKVYELMQSVIQSDSSILITGESGTGKELIARAIHVQSDKKIFPFITINCGAFNESLLESEIFGHEKEAFTGAAKTKQGRLELAGNGTFLLDEAGDLSPQMQIKLFMVLKTREFKRVGGTETIKLNARIITATGKNLLEEIQAGRFSEDLYYKISDVNINLPPLRERMDDIPILINHFMELFREKFKRNINSISPAAMQKLKKYNWPGNVRELENVLEYCFIVCKEIEIDTGHLPEKFGNNTEHLQLKFSNGAKINFKNAEAAIIMETLQKYNGNRQKTAEELGLDRTTLWRKMKKLGLN